MKEYILSRSVVIIFILSSLLLSWSLFGPTDYHFTRYHDVHIISEKTETIRNKSCDTPSHDHYMIKKITVEWEGTNNDGVVKTFTSEFDDEDDKIDGLTYHDLHNGTAKMHKCFKSCLTWIGWVFSCMLFLFVYCTEDDSDYSFYDRKDINKFRIKAWKIFVTFLGYNTEVINNVCQYFNNSSDNLNKIIKYSLMFSKYKEEYQNFSTVTVSSNENKN